ncbi:hypothetical protein K6U06_02730 [Acidiferrimicrobium sp. IK]|nr:hypothetical protein [Acidiferrimicrobium sp. IK]MCU4183261.1 hypothetical protein [Acidiferrimicrobium sp. IK]
MLIEPASKTLALLAVVLREVHLCGQAGQKTYDEQLGTRSDRAVTGP